MTLADTLRSLIRRRSSLCAPAVASGPLSQGERDRVRGDELSVRRDLASPIIHTPSPQPSPEGERLSLAVKAHDRRGSDPRTAIRIRDVTRRFGDFVALDRISIDIRAGEFFV